MTGDLVHLMGEELVPPCMDPVVNPAAQGSAPGVWTTVASQVTCPDCLEWVHA
jgi:hypothetical protein